MPIESLLNQISKATAYAKAGKSKFLSEHILNTTTCIILDYIATQTKVVLKYIILELYTGN